MILLNITNASEVMASKIGKLLESLTPDSFDHAVVEDKLIAILADQLSREGLCGDVAAVQGVDLVGRELVLKDRCHVRSQRSF